MFSWSVHASILFFDLIVDVKNVVEKSLYLAIEGLIKEVDEDKDLIDNVAIEKIVGLVGEFNIVGVSLLPVFPSINKVTMGLVLDLLPPIFLNVFELFGSSHCIHLLLDLFHWLGMHQLFSKEELFSELLV